MLKREDYLNIVNQGIKNPNLVKHCLAVEVVMKALAKKLGGDETQWGNLGLVHDADWEVTGNTPAEHTKVTEKWLKEAGETDQALIDGLLAHNYQNNGFREPNSPMEWALYTCDELTGLIIAVALVRGKNLSGVTAESVLKKFPQKAFAAGVNRDQISMCEAKLNIPLPEFVDLAVKAMQTINKELGLA